MIHLSFTDLAARPPMRKARPPRRAGFSLIEVTLAIGIVACALLSVVALLPVGLNSTKNAADEAHAVQILKSLTISIQGASSKPSPAAPGVPTKYTYTALAPYDKLSPSLDWDVTVSTTGAPKRKKVIFWIGPAEAAKYVAAVCISPPKDKTAPGKAYIMVMWPGVGMNILGTNSAKNPGPIWNTPSNKIKQDYAVEIVQLPSNRPMSYVESSFYFNAN